ncbi:MAG TPA: hypothetical protein VM490_22080 [Armatimonadaceae bacterium]|jgi:hypothetical protein|nr:hypothetical protein [Armatimonadaceae bacterium]
MTYKRCCACDFWVTASEKRCPNCGIQDPRVERTDTLTMETPMTDGTRAAFGGFIGAVIGGFLMDGMGVAVGVAVGVSLGVLLGADREWGPGEVAALATAGRTRHQNSLRHDEETIQQRLSDIAAREKRLAEARQKVEMERGNISEDRWVKVCDALDSASQILSRQRERYHARLWDVALVRWQNTLEPLAADWDRLTHEECNHRLRQLEAARDRGEAYLREWEGVDLSDVSEAQQSVKRLKTALASCDKLREALIVQQAALAVKGIAPMDEALQPSLAPADSLKNLDLFNARAAIGEFSSAFSELEAEYARLRSEEELAERAVLARRMG